MIRSIIFILTLLLTHSVFSQDKLKLTRGKKTVILNKKKQTSFYQSIKSPDGDSINLCYDARLEKINSDTIILKPEQCEQIIYFADKRCWQTNTFYSSDTLTRIKLYKNDIDRILVSRPLANGLLYAGLLAAISAVVVSPLASVNYTKGTLNKNKYATIAGVSTGIFVPCMVIGINLNYRKYNIKSGKNPWTIEY